MTESECSPPMTEHESNPPMTEHECNPPMTEHESNPTMSRSVEPQTKTKRRLLRRQLLPPLLLRLW